MTEQRTIVFDPEERRVGCPIIQAMFGGTVSNADIMDLPWALVPTPSMALYPCNDETLAKLRVICGDAP